MVIWMDVKFDFSNKVAIVTGASGGLGKETAVQFARAGAKVVIGDLKVEAGRRTEEGIRAEAGEAIFIELDVTSKESVDHLVKNTIETFGGVDILINVAGVPGSGEFSAFKELLEEQWDITYNVNLKGQVFCCQAVYDIFRDQRHGKIVNVSSVAGKIPTPTIPHYGASKAASVSLTRSLAYDMARFNVNVNGVCPGWIWTPIYTENPALDRRAAKDNLTTREIFDKTVKRMVPFRREQTEADIAYAIMFLCSEAARNITAQNINVDGGAVIY
jgi:meso-butanediol dehydrogenase/(S,S)-butanediol dehydrogenase/diacetyl reductase